MAFVLLMPFRKTVCDKANACGGGRDFVRQINLASYAGSAADNCAVGVAFETVLSPGSNNVSHEKTACKSRGSEFFGFVCKLPVWHDPERSEGRGCPVCKPYSPRPSLRSERATRNYYFPTKSSHFTQTFGPEAFVSPAESAGVSLKPLDVECR